MDDQHLITIEPGKRSGQPCVRGMRITVRDVLKYLAGGMTVDELLGDFPELTAEDVRACLAYAANQLPRPATDDSREPETERLVTFPLEVISWNAPIAMGGKCN